MRIGGVWAKTTENGKEYLSASIDKAILTLYPQLKDFSFTLWENENQTENAPLYYIDMSPKKKKEEKVVEIPISEEIPFI